MLVLDGQHGKTKVADADIADIHNKKLCLILHVSSSTLQKRSYTTKLPITLIMLDSLAGCWTATPGCRRLNILEDPMNTYCWMLVVYQHNIGGSVLSSFLSKPGSALLTVQLGYWSFKDPVVLCFIIFSLKQRWIVYKGLASSFPCATPRSV